jgi:hypothetical protein
MIREIIGSVACRIVAIQAFLLGALSVACGVTYARVFPRIFACSLSTVLAHIDERYARKGYKPFETFVCSPRTFSSTNHFPDRLGLCFWQTYSLANGNSRCGLASQYLRRENDHFFNNRFRGVCLVRYCFRQCPWRGRQGGSLN